MCEALAFALSLHVPDLGDEIVMQCLNEIDAWIWDGAPAELREPALIDAGALLSDFLQRAVAVVE